MKLINLDSKQNTMLDSGFLLSLTSVVRQKSILIRIDWHYQGLTGTRSRLEFAFPFRNAKLTLGSRSDGFLRFAFPFRSLNFAFPFRNGTRSVPQNSKF